MYNRSQNRSSLFSLLRNSAIEGERPSRGTPRVPQLVFETRLLGHSGKSRGATRIKTKHFAFP